MNLYTELIAIDIGTSSIKLIAIDPGPGQQGYVLKNITRIDLPLGLIGGDFTSPFISDITVFKRCLEELIKKLKSRRQGFVVGLPDRWVKMNLQTIPLSESELKNPQFLSWRLEKSFPAPEGMKTIVDFQVLEKTKLDDDEAYHVLCAAVNKDIVDILSSITTDLDMEVMAFDTSSLGVFNLYEEVSPEKTLDQTIINLHTGHETTVVKVYRKGIIIYERVIEVAGEEFAKIISELDSINLESAMKVKVEEKFFPVNRKDIVELIPKRARIERVFGNWLRELNVTFRFFQEKFKISKLPNVFMTGGSVMFPGLPNFLSEYFETSFDIFNPIEELPLAKKVNDKITRQGPAYAACLGLLAK